VDGKRKQRSSWQTRLTFPQPFSYEVDAPLTDVVKALADLEQEPLLFRRLSHEVSVLPADDDYFFRIRARRNGTLVLNTEGRISEDETGCVIVEGETQFNTATFLASYALMLAIGLFTALSTAPILLIPFLLSMLAGIWFTAVIYKRDRRYLMRRMEQALHAVADRSTSKLKRHASSRLALDETSSGSVWDGALTDEYGDERQRNRR